MTVYFLYSLMLVKEFLGKVIKRKEKKLNPFLEVPTQEKWQKSNLFLKHFDRKRFLLLKYLK